MANYQHIQRRIDFGRGRAAEHLGQPFSVYRVQANSATNYLDAENLVAANFPVFYRQRAANGFGGSFEGGMPGVPLWDIVANMDGFIVGDVFVQTDAAVPTGYGPGATLVNYPTIELEGFCFGFHGPVKKSIGARVERLAQIYRPAQTPTTSNGYFDLSLDLMRPVLLQNGNFVLGTNGQSGAALIPVGWEPPSARLGRDLFEQIPDATKLSMYVLYLPPTAGFTLKEADRIQFQDGSRYVVDKPYEQQSGFVGTRITMFRETSQG